MTGHGSGGVGSDQDPVGGVRAAHGTSPEELAIVLKSVPGAPDVEVLSADLIFSEPAASATVGVWRFSAGTWSVILKVLRHGSGGSPNWQSGDAPEHWYYWRREALAYSSGLLDSLAGELRAPDCYGVFDRVDGSVGIWLEDLRNAEPAGSWDVERYRAAAAALGHTQGSGVGPALGPGLPWLARDWLRRYVERRESFLPILDQVAWNLPVIRDNLPADAADEAAAIWNEREIFLSAVEAAPVCLGHNDLHPGNLFGEGPTTVLIDWGFLGLGRAGEDPANLVFDAVLDFFVEPGRFDHLQSAVIEGYLDGVAAAQPDADLDVIRRAVWAAGAVKYFWIPLAMVDAAGQERETLNRRPLDEAVAAWSPVVPHIFEFAYRLRSGM